MGVAARTQNLGHIARIDEHLVELVYIAVLAHDVALHHLTVEDVCIAIDVVMAGKYLEVAVGTSHGHIVFQHILTGEVYHRGYSIVEHSEHGTACILETRVILVVGWHSLGGERGHSVCETHVRGVLHQLALKHRALGILLVRQCADEDGIVEHRREQQFSLL